MSKNSKVVKRVIGSALIIISGVTGIYQYEFTKIKSDSKQMIVVAKSKINTGDTLTNDNVELVLREKESLSNGYINNLDLALGSVANETIYENEEVNSLRIISEEEYKKLNLKLVSIKCKENTLVGYSIKPYDKVDILSFDSQGTYQEKFLEGQVIYDLRSAEGVSYAKRDENFKAVYALIWVSDDNAKKINENQEIGGYYIFQQHRKSEADE